MWNVIISCYGCYLRTYSPKFITDDGLCYHNICYQVRLYFSLFWTNGRVFITWDLWLLSIVVLWDATSCDPVSSYQQVGIIVASIIGLEMKWLKAWYVPWNVGNPHGTTRHDNLEDSNRIFTNLYRSSCHWRPTIFILLNSLSSVIAIRRGSCKLLRNKRQEWYVT